MKYQITIEFEASTEKAAVFAFKNATEKIAWADGSKLKVANLYHDVCPTNMKTLVSVQTWNPEDFSNWQGKPKANEATAYAQQFAESEDGGSCNFDSCTIPVPGMQKRAAEKIGGATLFTGGFFGRRLHLNGTLGQANRHTRMAEAQRDFLRENYPDLNPGMYYMLD